MGHREATVDTAIEEAIAIIVAGAYWGHKASTVIEVATASSYWDQKQEVANTAARVAC